MARHKSAIKAHKQSLKRALRNRMVRTKVKTLSKKVEGMIAAGNKSQAAVVLKVAESTIMGAVTKRVLKLNTASRKISRLTHKVKLLDKDINS